MLDQLAHKDLKVIKESKVLRASRGEKGRKDLRES
jgi:hypothetical protein